ncbi:MAG: hypothetical protein CM15mV28_1590 [Thaumasvirus sp.]|nr:MAG: hypothetical protein CM15mV28_1590 [Thaumasvirus sp.]
MESDKRLQKSSTLKGARKYERGRIKGTINTHDNTPSDKLPYDGWFDENPFKRNKIHETLYMNHGHFYSSTDV